MFSERDLAQIEQHGVALESVESQIESFRSGFGFLPIERAATPGDGVVVMDRESGADYAELYQQGAKRLDIVKFVPASGAATRMFKELFEYADKRVMTAGIESLVANVERLAMYGEIESGVVSGDAKSIVEAMLEYGSQLPKGLLAFHKYSDEVRTAMDEHLVEGAMYAQCKGEVRIHFTISAEHADGFKKQLKRVRAEYEKRYGVRYDISFSQQSNSTDTIAVTLDNEPFREDDGSLLFRPAGHGALLENLNAIDADLIFIKNIDNVTTDRLKDDTSLYNKFMAGVLLALQSEIFSCIETLNEGANEEVLYGISGFLSKVLSCELPEGFAAWDMERRVDFLRRKLDRPIRLCGMVRNEGEQGGGPFWVRNADGTVSLQIAEPSQISPQQAHLLKDGTHFNPVALVCGVRGYRGTKFDLSRFSDPSTGFISEKSKNGRPLKAQELPGLWNGAMADWHTIFMEVPISTFSPVKEVKDLLREQHQ